MEKLRLPVVSLSAEHLAIGYLMRRNVLAYKAPPNNEGYDLICIHPDPRRASKQVRVQVKSRYATDHNRAFPVKAKSLDAFEFLVVAFLNIGYFYRKQPTLAGYREPEFYTLPRSFIETHHRIGRSGWEMVRTRGVDMSQYRNERGFDLIARKLGVRYPSRTAG
ncbi:MAG: hypothetical protein ACT4NU_06590 [Chromatiales bacterium]